MSVGIVLIAVPYGKWQKRKARCEATPPDGGVYLTLLTVLTRLTGLTADRMDRVDPIDGYGQSNHGWRLHF